MRRGARRRSQPGHLRHRRVGACGTPRPWCLKAPVSRNRSRTTNLKAPALMAEAVRSAAIGTLSDQIPVPRWSGRGDTGRSRWYDLVEQLRRASSAPGRLCAPPSAASVPSNVCAPCQNPAGPTATGRRNIAAPSPAAGEPNRGVHRPAEAGFALPGDGGTVTRFPEAGPTRKASAGGGRLAGKVRTARARVLASRSPKSR